MTCTRPTSSSILSSSAYSLFFDSTFRFGFLQPLSINYRVDLAFSLLMHQTIKIGAIEVVYITVFLLHVKQEDIRRRAAVRVEVTTINEECECVCSLLTLTFSQASLTSLDLCQKIIEFR